jgi:uncharacterized protein YciW
MGETRRPQAWVATVAPEEADGLLKEAYDIDALRGVGLSDADIVALNNLAAYYSYTNRVATGLGLRSEVPAAHAVGAAPR